MTASTEEPGQPTAHLNERLGWWALLLFLTLGILLEAFNGFKASFYLDVSNETRRHMWTLGHAHGTLLALVNVVFGMAARSHRLELPIASRCLLGAMILMPAGFLLGGAVTHAGDPGIGIVGVPFGGVLLLAGVFLTARAISNR